MNSRKMCAFPCIFPVMRENDAETGSPLTASRTILLLSAKDSRSFESTDVG